MTPWQVIEEALTRRSRGAKWLADQLDESIQTVSNWKARGVPVRRFREIGTVLGLSVDQIEGLEPPPWDGGSSAYELDADVYRLAIAINQLPRRQREWVLKIASDSVEMALATALNQKEAAQESIREERATHLVKRVG